MKQQAPEGSPDGGRPAGRRRDEHGTVARVHPETVRRIERSMGTLGTAAIAAMDERLPWFRKMSAENRSWLGLVAQAEREAAADIARRAQGVSRVVKVFEYTR